MLVRRDAERRFAPQPMGNPKGLERQWIVWRQCYGVARYFQGRAGRIGTLALGLKLTRISSV